MRNHAKSLALWDALVRSNPESGILIGPEGHIHSRAEIDTRADQLCARWREEGLKAHRLLVINIGNGVEWISAFIGAMKLGAIIVPLDPGLDAGETLRLLNDIRAQGLWDGCSLMKRESVPVRSFNNLNIALGKLTSGSTGKPRLILFTEAEMLSDGHHLIEGMGLLPEDINLGVIPWGHSYGLGNIVYPLLIQGTQVTWTETAFPSMIAEVCERTGATVFPSVPTLLSALVRSSCESSAFSSLRLVISAGARLAPEVASEYENKFGCIPHNFYGSTETGGICFDRTGEASLSGFSLGTPLEGVNIREGKGKRFYVQSGAVFSYGNHRSRKGEAGIHLASDFGHVNEEGGLVLEKRAKNILKIGGRRIHPGDVESRLEELEGVTQSMVAGIEVNEEMVIGAAIETDLPRVVLLALIRKQIPKRLRPKKIECFLKFPMTRRGKIDQVEILKKLKPKSGSEQREKGESYWV